MPIITINTNVKEIPAGFKSKICDLTARRLGKPKSYIAVHVNAGQDIDFGGTEEPAALCDLVSIGALSVETNKAYSKEFMDLLKSYMGIDSSRIYISFHDMNKADIGYNGTTFHQLLG